MAKAEPAAFVAAYSRGWGATSSTKAVPALATARASRAAVPANSPAVVLITWPSWTSTRRGRRGTQRHALRPALWPQRTGASGRDFGADTLESEGAERG